MENSRKDLVSNLEISDEDDDDFFNQKTSHMDSFDEEKLLKDIIISQSVFSPKTKSPSPNPQSKFGTTIVDPCGLPFDETSLDGHGTTLKSCISSNSIITFEKPSSSSSSQLSFGNTNIVEPIYPKHDDYALVSSKKRLGNRINIEPREQQRPKKVRNSFEPEDHIMAERIRRQELTRGIIALSAIIPELKKKDKAHVLHEAANYVKQLQERVRELENQNTKGCTNSTIFIKKTKLCTNGATLSCETNCDGCHGCIKDLPEVEARVLEKEVFIGILCEKQKDSFLKILALLKNLHLPISSTSILPFGASIVKITIIAQMDDEYNITTNDLVKQLRQHLLNLSHRTCNATVIH